MNPPRDIDHLERFLVALTGTKNPTGLDLIEWPDLADYLHAIRYDHRSKNYDWIDD